MNLTSAAISKLMVGSNAASRAYLGAVEVWSAIDPDAAAYIAAIETAGATVSPTQSAAIDAFIVAEKAGSRWDLIKRLYLPIWALEAPNAICMRSLTSGTFVGGVTHGNGFVQGDGSTGYFDTAFNMRTSLSSYSATGALSALCYQQDSRTDRRVYMGAQNGGDHGMIEQPNGTTAVGRVFSSAISVTGRTGIFFACSLAGRETRFIVRRSSLGTTETDNLNLNTVFAASASVALMARNLAGVYDLFHNGRFGHFGLHAPISKDESKDFTLGLKTLWETCTGLTLP